jgi:hypothetical protein
MDFATAADPAAPFLAPFAAAGGDGEDLPLGEGDFDLGPIITSAASLKECPPKKKKTNVFATTRRAKRKK